MLRKEIDFSSLNACLTGEITKTKLLLLGVQKKKNKQKKRTTHNRKKKKKKKKSKGKQMLGFLVGEVGVFWVGWGVDWWVVLGVVGGLCLSH